MTLLSHLAPGMRVRIAAERVRQVAKAQEGVIGRGQLTDCGLSGGDISRWISQGRLIRILPSVYAVGHAHLTWRARLVAALLYAGEGSILSHQTAAVEWKLVEARAGATVHVTTPGRRRSFKWVKVHRSNEIDFERRNGLPVTSLARTLVDYAAGRDFESVRKSLANADFHHTIDGQAIASVMRHGRPGSGNLRRAIKVHMPELAATLSPLEDAMLYLCERYAIPRPAPTRA